MAGELITKPGPKPKERFVPDDTYRKECNGCRRSLPASAFWKRKASADGLAFTCKECQRDNYRNSPELQERSRAALAKHHEDNPDLKRRQRLRKYNLTPEQYAALLEQQGGVCAICKRLEVAQLNGEFKALAVDHCHETGVVRGLLCQRCNMALGLFGDDLDILRGAIAYLEGSNGCR